MATKTENKPSLKERIAAVKAKKDAAAVVAKKAKTRTLCAFTIAKTMLPNAPASAVEKLSSALLYAPTKVLIAALQQTAINAHNKKQAAEDVHAEVMNDPKLQDKPSELEKLKKEVAAEAKGKTSSAKAADDRKENGEQPEKYDEGKRETPTGPDGGGVTLDASTAADRTSDTINMSEGEDKKIKEAAAKKTACIGEGCAGCPGCKTASEESKTAAEEGGEEAPAEEPKSEGEEAPAESPEEAPAEEAPAEEPPIEGGEEPAAEEAAETIFDSEQMQNISESIESAQNSIEQLKEQIEQESNAEPDYSELGGGEENAAAALFGEDDPMMDVPPAGGEELVMDDIFANTDDNVNNLANEGDEGFQHAAAADDFFGPSEPSDMDAQLDGAGAGEDFDPFYNHTASADVMDMLMGRTASDADVDPGEFANYFNEQSGETRDEESDHDGDIFADVLKSLKPESNKQTRTPQDAKPKMELPKGAKYTGKLKVTADKTPAQKTASYNANAIADALFGAEE